MNDSKLAVKFLTIFLSLIFFNATALANIEGKSAHIGPPKPTLGSRTSLSIALNKQEVPYVAYSFRRPTT